MRLRAVARALLPIGFATSFAHHCPERVDALFNSEPVIGDLLVRWRVVAAEIPKASISLLGDSRGLNGVDGGLGDDAMVGIVVAADTCVNVVVLAAVWRSLAASVMPQIVDSAGK